VSDPWPAGNDVGYLRPSLPSPEHLAALEAAVLDFGRRLAALDGGEALLSDYVAQMDQIRAVVAAEIVAMQTVARQVLDIVTCQFPTS
jgi:hypothetical protein